MYIFLADIYNFFIEITGKKSEKSRKIRKNGVKNFKN